jgi:hypothetical protein
VRTIIETIFCVLSDPRGSCLETSSEAGLDPIRGLE